MCARAVDVRRMDKRAEEERRRPAATPIPWRQAARKPELEVEMKERVSLRFVPSCSGFLVREKISFSSNYKFFISEYS